MRPVRVIAHTHWDREWYLSFEQFQEQLVETMDRLLDLLEKDDRWTHFHLDGQTALVDDYLAKRPEREAELSAHIAKGTLSCGPWVTLVDEFLVSGESIIRNLEDGMARAQDLGGVMMIGYLPDQFGHVGQMPQLLRRVGIERAVVWRGVPAEITHTAFTWVGSDLSEVDVLYLPFGYGHGRQLMTVPDGFSQHLEDEAARLEPFLGATEPLLVMAGGDHVPPSPALTDHIAEHQEKDVDIKLTSLPDLLSTRTAPAQIWRGELRSGARANLLPNTYSVRVHQKLARARAENSLERYAEPLAALVPGFEWPARRFKEAWSLMHLNGAHDSVCGCSIDEVANAVDVRTERVQEIANATIQDALSMLISQIGKEGTLLYNPSSFERDDVPALGWKVVREPPAPRPVELGAADDLAIVTTKDDEFHFTFEDQGDEGDLYTFSPKGDPLGPNKVSSVGGGVRFSFDTCNVSVTAEAAPKEPIVRLRIEIDNKKPDHRLRLVVRLPHKANTSVAGSVFEVVERPIQGEGGESEPASTCWPARGFVTARDVGILSEGVFEYELTGPALAMTLLRCVGTISRYELPTRKVVAGPDVPTPEAQMIGKQVLEVGLMTASNPRTSIELWERFALPLHQVPCSGEGGLLLPEGRFLDLDVPALSSVRRVNGRIAATVWNPLDRDEIARVGEKHLQLGPHRIETVILDQ